MPARALADDEKRAAGPVPLERRGDARRPLRVRTVVERERHRRRAGRDALEAAEDDGAGGDSGAHEVLRAPTGCCEGGLERQGQPPGRHRRGVHGSPWLHDREDLTTSSRPGRPAQRPGPSPTRGL